MIICQPLTAEAFAPYGDVLAADGAPDRIINQGLCGRYHDRARLDFGPEPGRAGLSIFRAEPRALPLELSMVERHPEGSQAFIPMTGDPFLIVVAADRGDEPGPLAAFLSDGQQAVNYHRGTWHGVLTPLAQPGLFAVLDRIGDSPNLEEHWFAKPFIIGTPTA